MRDQRLSPASIRRVWRQVSERVETLVIVGMALLVLVYGGGAMAQVMVGIGRMVLAVLRG